MQKVDEIEEAYTGEEVKVNSLCFLPKRNIVVTVTEIYGNIYAFDVHNGGWPGKYNAQTKRACVDGQENPPEDSYPSLSGEIMRIYIDPWVDAGEMMVVDQSMLSDDCLKQWYLERHYKYNHSGKIEEIEEIYRDCF
jgi:hypothetical protein